MADLERTWGLPPRWLDCPGSITRHFVFDPRQSDGWVYESGCVTIGFDQKKMVNRLSVYLDFVDTLPSWFIGWFPKPGTTLKDLKLRLREIDASFHEHCGPNFGYCLSVSPRTCVPTAPFLSGKLVVPDERRIKAISRYRDEADFRRCIGPSE